ncbi:MAG: Uma2 family endonuclease [Ktedonobacteraceae bacterium]
MATQSNLPKMSVEEYFKLDESSLETKYEFIDGNVYMLAGGTADHSIIGANIIRELGNRLGDSPCRVYTSDMRVYISEKRYVYPDISVSCDAQDRGRIKSMQYPRLVIEILSPSTEAYDRGMKAFYYRACTSIQEYVLVDTQRQAVEIYRRDEEPFWMLSPYKEHDVVTFSSLNMSIPIDAIYRNISLPEDTSL